MGKGFKANFKIIVKKLMSGKKKHLLWITPAVIIFIVAAILVVKYIYAQQTYTQINVLATYQQVASSNGNYKSFATGILRYSRDGISYFTVKGKEVWNHPYQIQSPLIEICKNTAVIADEGGTKVLVVGKNGVKGEFQTSRPIEQIAVSKQGIVAAVLKDETTPKVVCYDSKGNLLVEQKASLANTGYPIGLAISQDGETLAVSYLKTNATSVSSELAYYNFGSDRSQNGQYEVARKTYDGMMIPTVAFMDSKSSVAIGDEGLVFWKGAKEPVEIKAVPLEGKITMCAYDSRYVALVIKDRKTSVASLHIYNKKGKKIATHEMSYEYDNIKISDSQVLLYKGNKCYIYDIISDVLKYEGDVDMDIDEIFKVDSFMKYIVVGREGMKKIQLKK